MLMWYLLYTKSHSLADGTSLKNGARICFSASESWLMRHQRLASREPRQAFHSFQNQRTNCSADSFICSFMDFKMHLPPNKNMKGAKPNTSWISSGVFAHSSFITNWCMNKVQRSPLMKLLKLAKRLIQYLLDFLLIWMVEIIQTYGILNCIILQIDAKIKPVNF